MRAPVPCLVILVAVLFPKIGNAQVFQFRTPTPEVTAANASWQVSGDPVVVEGLVYYATRGFRMFDGQVMAQIGVYDGVPVYADTTLEPWSIAYVPIGRDRMRAYERLRDRELAGTTGSRMPSFPVRPTSAGTPVTFAPASPVPVGSIDERPVATAGAIVTIPDRTPPTRTRIESIPRPSATNGIWLEYNGDRWYAAGAAVPFVADRFTPIGEYRGFAVYKSASGNSGRIWVSVVKDGPLAPYEKR